MKPSKFRSHRRASSTASQCSFRRLCLIFVVVVMLFISFIVFGLIRSVVWWKPPGLFWIVGITTPTLMDAARYEAAIEWTSQSATKQSTQQLRQQSSIRRYLHIISPYHDPGRIQSQLHVMASIEIARAWMQRMRPDVTVHIVTVEDKYNHTDTDSPKRPQSFMNSKVILDYTTFDHHMNVFTKKEAMKTNPNTLPDSPTVPPTTKRLPLLRDLLSAGLTTDQSYSHVIFTNMDIFLMPFFYAAVDDMVNCRINTFFFNRWVGISVYCWKNVSSTMLLVSFPHTLQLFFD